jgi:glutamate synthase domain-containing protein 1
VRLQAIHALGTVGDATAVGVLARIDGQPTFGEYACDALRRLKSRGVDGANEALDGWRGACPAAALPPPPGAR